MTDDTRFSIIGGLWFMTAIVLVALFISAAAMGDLTAAHVALTLLLLVLGVVGTAFFLRFKDGDSGHVKAKHERIDNLLSDLSDVELAELRRRLTDDHRRREDVLDYIDDDG